MRSDGEIQDDFHKASGTSIDRLDYPPVFIYTSLINI
jgi:hypothetical protein